MAKTKKTNRPPGVKAAPISEVIPAGPIRTKLPRERPGVTHEFMIRGADDTFEGFLTVNTYPDGAVGEIFLRLSQQGTTVSGFADAWAISVSIMLQTGVPLRRIVDKYRGMRFEPAGFTDDKNVRTCTSPVDYVAKWLGSRFLGMKWHNEEEGEKGGESKRA